VPTTVYRPEALDAFEVGLKTQLFDRHLRFNTAGFYYKYTDLQINSYPNSVLLITNGAKATLYGADFTADAAISSQFHLNAGLSLLHSRFDKYQDAAIATPRPQGGNAYLPFNAVGAQLPKAVKTTLTVAGTYTIPTSIGEFEFNATYAYNGGWDGEIGGRVHQNAYDLVNTRIAWRSSEDKYEIALWAKNLTDTTYALARYSTSDSDRVKWAPPRTYGVSAEVRF
jgi:iron complex outermembrane receptor protein